MAFLMKSVISRLAGSKRMTLKPTRWLSFCPLVAKGEQSPESGMMTVLAYRA